MINSSKGREMGKITVCRLFLSFRQRFSFFFVVFVIGLFDSRVICGRFAEEFAAHVICTDIDSEAPSHVPYE